MNLFSFSISRLLGSNPHFHNLSLRTTVYSRPIQLKGQFVKDLPAVKCKYLILLVKKMFPKNATVVCRIKHLRKGETITKVSGKGK